MSKRRARPAGDKVSTMGRMDDHKDLVRPSDLMPPPEPKEDRRLDVIATLNSARPMKGIRTQPDKDRDDDPIFDLNGNQTISAPFEAH